ncbi:hypothetical protein CDD82_5384 [Ophiocordyceps australis]|uniref:Cullin family profile domain-containing protein n=1 Tax=Ophiocordyceps australis TaxID=1399860 RepID=A0A2C5XIF9_9HYPO|nr:hypothetical protein CDD82_5384 [Ophiocordyceps australis]
MQDSSSPRSRRRPRLSSSSSSSAAAAVATKRARYEYSTDANTAVDAPSAMASARAKGKMPEAAALPVRPTPSNPLSSSKKLLIRNFRKHDGREAKVHEYYARVEQQLDSAVGALLNGTWPHVPLESLYRGVEDVCRRGDADKILTMLDDRIGSHLQTAVLPRIQAAANMSDLDVLRSFMKEWKVWMTQTVTIRSTFSYFDRTYLLRGRFPCINEMAISHFRRVTFSAKGAASLGLQVIAGICQIFEYDRRHDERLDQALLKDSIRMLNVLGVYVQYFDPIFLQQSEAYYRDFGKSWADASLKDYIAAVETLLAREHHRCITYSLDSTTEKRMMDWAHEILISHYSERLLHSTSLAHLLEGKDVKSMKGLYQLLQLSGLEKKVKTPWAEYIKTAGASIISDKDRGDEMVLRLLELRRSLDLMIRDAFGMDDDFLWAMREGFGGFMNDRKTALCWETGTSKVGEMTAKYIDMLLRGGTKALPSELLSDVKDRIKAEKQGEASSADEEAELDRQLDQALELFRFIEGKDTFEAFYKRDLARRLLMRRSASQDAERNMLTKLRGECGSNFTHNLEQMFKDQELAKDEMDSYRQLQLAKLDQKPPVDLDVMILSAAAWPSFPDLPLKLPDQVATQIERFDAHYKKKHTGRVLTWKHTLAHCVMTAVYPKGTKELLVSASQAVVLMLFNSLPDDGFLSYEQVSFATGLQGGELNRTLQSLACGKARVLSKHPKGRDVKQSDTFTFNRGFSDAKYRVKINQIQLRETKDENKATHERIAQDRRFETQAAIVRIMKSRKRMTHGDLVAEVINMTKKRGSVEPAAIKKEIESLIEKDYLEREDNAYTYLA